MLLKNILLLAVLLSLTPACKKQTYHNLSILERAEVDLEDELNAELEYKGFSKDYKAHYWMVNKKIKLPSEAFQHRADTTFEEEFTSDVLSIIPKQKGKCNFYSMMSISNSVNLYLAIWVFTDSTIISVSF